MFLNKFSLFFYLTILISLCSCNKSDNINSPQLGGDILGNDESELVYNQFVNEFSKRMVSQLNKTNKKANENAFLKFIVDKCKLKFDGDYNFLIKDFINETIEIDKTFLEYFDIVTQNNLINTLKIEPNMQIAIPILIDKINLKNPEIGGIVYLRNNIDEEKEEFINGINMLGEEIKVLTSVEPKVPFIVISFNENSDINQAKEIIKSIDKDHDNKININQVKSNKLLNCDNQYIDQDNDLDSGDLIDVRQYKLLNMHESWFSGKPEVRMRWLTQSGATINTVQDNPKRKNAKNQKWVEVDKYTFTYQANVHGEDFYVGMWFEYDGGNDDTTYTFSFDNVYSPDSTTTIEIEYSTSLAKKDDPYGEALVPIADPSGSCYQANDAIFILESN